MIDKLGKEFKILTTNGLVLLLVIPPIFLVLPSKFTYNKCYVEKESAQCVLRSSGLKHECATLRHRGNSWPFPFL